jgi:branched-chain amino acid transport system permease protein
MDTLLQQLVNGLQSGAIYAMLGLGFSMVYGVLKLMNFAHGDVFMLGAFIGWWSGSYFLGALPLPFVPTLISAMLLCALINVLVERIAYRPLRKAPRMSMLITAMAMSMILEHGTRAIVGTQFHPFPDVIERVTHVIGPLRVTNAAITTLILAIVLMAITDLVVRKTRLGRAMRAVSFDMTASILMGINVNTVISFTFALGGMLAGATGIVYGLTYPSVEPYMGMLPGLKGFIACAIGGIGSTKGAVLGGLLLGYVEVFAGGYMPSTLRDTVAFVVLIIFLMFRPSGLLNVPWFTERV